MRYGILGTTQAHSDDGTPATPGGARLRALLAALALSPGRGHTAGALIDAVWDGEPPADAAGALQALVGRLRRALGAAAVESVPGGYRLRAEPDDVDLNRFERLAGEGERALADGDPAKAAALLDDALALWRGPALADLPGHEAYATRLSARRLAARRARLSAAVALGDAPAVLPDLDGLCAEHPLDEPLQALRLRALRAAGRPAEALAAYEEIRRDLAERLGANPGPELRELHGELLAAPRSARPASEDERGAAALRARGGAPEETVKGRDRGTPTRPRGNLRARATSFVGRDEDLRRIGEDLAHHRLVTLLGPGGAGKTRLSQEAAEAAARTREDWPDGVWLAELAPVDDGDDPGIVAETVLTALGARETVVRGSAAAEGLRAAADGAAADPLARLAELCAPRRMLLVLDNCEHLIDAAARVAEALLAHCPGVTVLATSREPLAVPGESLRPVEPLPTPVALRLLADRGAAARPGFRTEDDPEACAEICRRLDGLPLAIELAAARLRMLTPRGLADRLDDRFRLLTSGSRTVLPRQQTLRAVVDWSWDLLDAPEHAVLRRLSVFAGGCDLAAAEAVCADGTEVHGPDVPALVGSLVDKSLVVAAPADDGEMRYRLLETVGEYAGERLDEAGERTAVERRHLVHYRELARTAEPLLRGPGQRRLLDVLEREHDNLRTALRRAVAARDEQETLCMVLSLGWFWQLRDHRADAATWTDVAVGMGPDPFAEPVRPAPPLTERCIDAPPPMGPELLIEARRQARLVWLVNHDTDMRLLNSPEMQRTLRNVVVAYRPGRPQNLRYPGVMWFYARLLTFDFDGLWESIDDLVERCREAGHEWELAFHLQQRAKLLNDRPGRADQGLSDAHESLEIFRRLGDNWGVAEALSGRAESHERRGALAEAERDYREAIDNARDLGANAQVPMLRARLADVLTEAGRADDAEGERMLREALEEAEGASADTTFFIRISLGVRLARRGRTAEAREVLDGLMEEFKNRSIKLFLSLMDGLYGWIEILDGNPAAALPLVRRSLGVKDDPFALLVASHLPVMHLLYGAYAHSELPGEEHASTGARLLGAAVALRPAGLYEGTTERDTRGRTEANLRAALGDEAYERTYAEGGRLTLEEAAALV
ncbi:BTAD domain-containing putative transcriptional regulator [Streptomyces luteireticuli]|uniref:AfsR/SARP family transcriptional regulator n=1 Tax=Streptomyces luteireticuli TaxID=173858 RepID=UPI0035566D19